MGLNNGLHNVPVRIEPGQSSLAPPPFNNNNNTGWPTGIQYLLWHYFVIVCKFAHM